LKAQTIDEKSWGNIVSFGSSAQFNLPDLLPKELPAFIKKIENELTSSDRIAEIPKAYKVNDKEMIQELDKKLAQAIIKAEENINVEEVSVYGINFIFSDQSKYGFYMAGNSRNKHEVEELNLDNLKQFISENNINLENSLNKIKVQVYREDGRPYSEPLKCFLDFVDEDNHYCLIDGKWHKFNPSYIKFLEREVDRLELNYDEKFDIDVAVKGNKYDETAFNDERVERDGFKNGHKNLESIEGHKVEMMDLYKDNIIYFVKIGEPNKMAYVIDQALNTVKILKNTQEVVEVNKESVEVKSICLWIILDKKSKIEKLSQVKSLIFKMKLVDWKKEIMDAGYTPMININYKFSK